MGGDEPVILAVWCPVGGQHLVEDVGALVRRPVWRSAQVGEAFVEVDAHIDVS
jgi:hypothetical protein